MTPYPYDHAAALRVIHLIATGTRSHVARRAMADAAIGHPASNWSQEAKAAWIAYRGADCPRRAS